MAYAFQRRLVPLFQSGASRDFLLRDVPMNMLDPPATALGARQATGFAAASEGVHPDAEDKIERKKAIDVWVQLARAMGPVSDLVTKAGDDLRTSVEDTLARKAEATLRARASAITLYMKWCRVQGQMAWPLDEQKMYDYMQALIRDGDPPTRATSFTKAVAFAGYHCEMPARELLKSPRCLGVAWKMFVKKHLTQQRAPCSVDQVR